jgi:hypothetical protein
MTTAKREVTRADILPVEIYAEQREAQRARVLAVKKNRHLEVGPVCSFYFESYDTMWHQIHEMLYIERGGEAQIADELAAYNPLVPKGDELVATVMFEIDEPDRRAALLAKLGGIEAAAFLRVAGETAQGVAETDLDRTTAQGKASSVQFIHFPLSPAQIAQFKTPGAEVIVGFTHHPSGLRPHGTPVRIGARCPGHGSGLTRQPAPVQGG